MPDDEFCRESIVAGGGWMGLAWAGGDLVRRRRACTDRRDSTGAYQVELEGRAGGFGG